MKIIGFAGPAGCGKDTAARYLIEHYRFLKVSFAGPLKAMLATMGYPEPPTQEEKERIIREFGVSWRHMAQTLGTEWGRKLVHPDIWVTVQMLHMAQHPELNYVFTDVRFENEAAIIRANGGRIIHLLGRAYPMPEGTAKHASETGIARQLGDYGMFNDCPLDELHQKLDIFIHKNFVRL